MYPHNSACSYIGGRGHLTRCCIWAVARVSVPLASLAVIPWGPTSPRQQTTHRLLRRAVFCDRPDLDSSPPAYPAPTGDRGCERQPTLHLAMTHQTAHPDSFWSFLDSPICFFEVQRRVHIRTKIIGKSKHPSNEYMSIGTQHFYQ